MKSLESYFREIGLIEGTQDLCKEEHLEDFTENSENFQIDESLSRNTQRNLLNKYNILRELTLNPSKIRKSFR